MNTFYEQATERNLGFWSEEDQDVLRNATVAIAGAGGDGGLLAEQVARMGVGTVRLADPDPFEVENINRQAFCNVDTLGMNKAVAVGAGIEKIRTDEQGNVDIKVEYFTDGISRDNVGEFVAGADLVIDETEFTIHSLGVSLARAARAENVPNMMAMNIGFAGTVTGFKARGGKTFEDVLGLSETASLDEIDEANVDIGRWLSYIPRYGDLKVLDKVARGEKSAPSVAPGVAMAAGMGATQAFLHLMNGRNNHASPIYAPKVLAMDAYTGNAKTISHPRAAFARHAAAMAIRSKLGKNPTTSF